MGTKEDSKTQSNALLLFRVWDLGLGGAFVAIIRNTIILNSVVMIIVISYHNHHSCYFG